MIVSQNMVRLWVSFPSNINFLIQSLDYKSTITLPVFWCYWYLYFPLLHAMIDFTSSIAYCNLLLKKQLLVGNMLKDGDYTKGWGARSPWYSVCIHVCVWAHEGMCMQIIWYVWEQYCNLLEVKDNILFTVISLVINTVLSTLKMFKECLLHEWKKGTNALCSHWQNKASKKKKKPKQGFQFKNEARGPTTIICCASSFYGEISMYTTLC